GHYFCRAGGNRPDGLNEPVTETRQFARELNLEPCTTAVSSSQSNGMAERFVKTMKEDYIAFMPKPNVRTAVHNLAVAIEHYNENHPHSA
uniref:integrase core domain-containing protein n=1 Tax=Escherichia coli TaxID=562 RepID=UPI0030C73BCF